MLSLVWFKRDLRVTDHPALDLAAAQGDVLPVYIVEPGRWAQPDASLRQWEFLTESLASLRTDLAALGQPLILRTGDAVEVLARLQARFGYDRIVSHQETGTAWTQSRDRRVAAWARDRGLPWVELPQSGVIRGPAARDDHSRLRSTFMAQPVLAAPALKPLAEATGALPSARALGLVEDRCPNRQPGGRPAAQQVLDSFLTLRGQGYRAALSSPLGAERACSRLSPYLSLGVMSLREAVQATTQARADHRGQRDWPASLKSFDARLGWRDQSVQQLEDAPPLEWRAPDPADDAARLSAWRAGETGLPFVDACMRYLAATGWLNFRMRAMVIGVACHLLRLDWQTAGQHLARQFTDYDPGVHWPQVQTHAGIAGADLPRIPNPVKLAYEHDPNGVFVRRWVPELAAIPDAFVHEPWRWPGARDGLSRRYPEPIIDPITAARAARAQLAARRPSTGFDGRKAPAAGLQRRVAHPAQMSLDL